VRLIAVALGALALAAPAIACKPPSEGAMEARFICPECHTPLDESSSLVAQQMKAKIRSWIAAGWCEGRIQNRLVATFGPGVLGVPATHGFDLLAWVLPFTGVGVGALALGAGAWFWSRNRAGPEPASEVPLAPELERRLDEELARFDG